MCCCGAIVWQPLLIRSDLTHVERGRAGNMAGFSSALLTRKSFLSGSAKVGRCTNGAKTFALFKKAQKQVKQATGPAKQTAKKVTISRRDRGGCSTLLACELTLCQSCRPASWPPKSLALRQSRKHSLLSGKTSQHQRALSALRNMARASNRTSFGCLTPTAPSG